MERGRGGEMKEGMDQVCKGILHKLVIAIAKAWV